MDDCACGGDRLGHMRAAKSVERFDLEMLAQSENRLLRQKRITVVPKHTDNAFELPLLLVTDEKFWRRDACQLVEEGLSILQLRKSELARAEIGVGKAK